MTKFIAIDYLYMMNEKRLTSKEQEKYDKLWEGLAETAKKMKRETNVHTCI